LITGASSGIGRACARALVKRGHRVFGTFRQEPTHLDPPGLEPVIMDVTDDDSVVRGVEEVIRAAGHIDVVVNNAGYVLAGAIEDTSLLEARRQLDTNFFGVLRVCHAVLPGMRARREGVIINIGSLGGLFGLPFQGIYTASKFALEGLTESLRHEVEPFGIRVTLVEPGDIATKITDNRVRAAAADADSPYAQSFARVLEIIEREERQGSPPKLVAALIVKLLDKRSPRQRYTVGRLSQRSSAWAKRWMPAPMFEWVIRSYYGLSP